MTPDLSFLICAIIAVVISGLAKGGFAGVGALAMPGFVWDDFLTAS